MSTFVLAHLSDPHLAPLPRPRLYELIGKRAGGFYNWRRNRRRIHLAAVLERIVSDLKAQAPDHIAVTGDLINLSLAAEYEPARAWLQRLGSPHDVTLVPGNHDTYVRAKAHDPELFWSDQMRADEAASGALASFPFLRRRGPLAFIGLSTAVPAAAFRATGLLGDEQLARLAQMLAALRGEAAFRIVLLHHPPGMAPAKHHDRLIDEDAFVAVLKEHGADLVLHGHEHIHAVRWLDTPRGTIPAVGVPSASSARGSADEVAAYNLYAIEGQGDGWRCEMVSRGLLHDGVGELRRAVLIGR